jgi:hypothetical protein
LSVCRPGLSHTHTQPPLGAVAQLGPDYHKSIERRSCVQIFVIVCGRDGLVIDHENTHLGSRGHPRARALSTYILYSFPRRVGRSIHTGHDFHVKKRTSPLIFCIGYRVGAIGRTHVSARGNLCSWYVCVWKSCKIIAAR